MALPFMCVQPRYNLPFAPRSASIGLFGGSFDPAHDGHVQVTKHALRRLRLDQVWWLVSPGNPLKPHGPAPLDIRIDHARREMQHPRVQVTDIEEKISTRYTADTLSAIRKLYPDRRFVWIMGADNLASFHHWENWRAITEAMPLAIVARPGQKMRALSSVAARSMARMRLPERDAHLLARMAPPAWCFLNIPMLDMSSSRLREAGIWRAAQT